MNLSTSMLVSLDKIPMGGGGDSKRRGNKKKKKK